MEPVRRFRITFAEEPLGVYPLYIVVEGWESYFVFSDGNRENLFWGNAISWFGNMQNIRLFNTTTRESEYEFTDHDGRSAAAFFEIPQIEGWVFFANRGFVYIYDFPNNPAIQSEYNLLQQFPKFRRYGPLLQINHGSSTIRFWDRGFETGTNWIRLIDYYEEHEEILLLHVGQGITETRIFNLRLEEYTGFRGSLPFFNDSRDVVISVNSFIHETGEIVIDIYTISNGIYTRVFTERIRAWRVEEMQWINDNEFRLNVEHFENEDQVFLIRRSGTNFEVVSE